MTEYDFGILRHVDDPASGTRHDSLACQPADGCVNGMTWHTRAHGRTSGVAGWKTDGEG